MLAEGLGHQTEDARDGGQVVDAVPAGLVDLVGLVEDDLQLGEGVRMVVLARHVVEPLGELFPLGPAVRGGCGDLLSELVVAPLGAGHAGQREPCVEHTVVGEAGERRQDLPMR